MFKLFRALIGLFVLENLYLWIKNYASRCERFYNESLDL